MARLPILPTIIVAAAVATMIALGIWQLERAEQKDALIESYRAAQGQPPIAYPTETMAREDRPLFRYATGFCARPLGRRVAPGHNQDNESGYAHIVDCETGIAGSRIAVELGWSRNPNAPINWAGGPVSGVIAPDRESGMRLVAATSPPGLAPSSPPSLDQIPRNHRSYAVQWFTFAAIALLIFVLALRRRSGTVQSS